MSDRNQLAPHKITAAGLSFVGATQAPKIADDIAALGALLMQLALGKQAAEVNAASVQDIADPHWRVLISACFGPAAQQPSASALARGPVHAESANAEPIVEAAMRPDTAANPLASPVPAVGAEQMIGPYRVFEKLGQGGMGVVYLAECREPVQRQVALKVILAGMDTSEVLARFDAERQALALMNHVNIAAVFDAGSSANGRPYFAMEYLPGLEITAHCDQRQLDFRSRIALFLQVCDGVLHAHQKGIIHRDLKPSNILVKDAQGQPATAKIIDFGVAKSLQRKLGNLSAHTQLGSFVGTPAYSSPEQICGSPAGLDTRSDTYSLGAVLFELLSGVPPYGEALLAAKSPFELSKIISGQEPPTLLRRFVSLEAKVEGEIAERRKVTVAQMKQTLGSDLAWIVAKCLERDPNDRYPSVMELQKDLHRWLDNRPVEARPITWRYRMRKMVRRNWAAVILGGVVVLAFVLTGSAAVVGFLHSERALAEAELAADFQTKQIQAINPSKMGMKLRDILLVASKQEHIAENGAFAASLASINMTDVTLEQLNAIYFDPALAAVEKDFNDSPLLQARIKHALALTLVNMEQYSKAIKIAESTLAKRTVLLGSTHPLTQESLILRGRVYAGLGMAAEAEADFRNAQQATNPQMIQALIYLGKLLIVQSRDQEAYDTLTRAVTLSREQVGNNAQQTFDALLYLSISAKRLLRLEEAENSAQEALDGLRQLYPSDENETLPALEALSGILSAQGKFEWAANYQRIVLKGYEVQFGNENPGTLAVRSNLAESLIQTGQFAEGISLRRGALDGFQKIFGENHPSTLKSQILLGTALRQASQFAEAQKLFDAVLQKLSSRPELNALKFEAFFQLGLLARDQGQFDKAERLLNDALAGRRELSGEKHVNTQAAMDALKELKVARSNQRN